MIIENLSKFKYRDKIQILTKEVKEDTGSNLLKAKVIKKYQYYICDYCGQEIRLDKRFEERDGGICTFRPSLIKANFIIELALHNRCLKPVVKEFEDKNAKEKNNENKNI